MTEKEMEAKITQAHIDGYNRGFAKAEEKIADIKANCDYVLEGKEIEHREERNKLCADFENMKATLESKIAELKEKLKEKLKTIADKDLSFVAKFDALENENAELKVDNDARRFAMNMSEKVEKQLREQLSKAKEIIKGLLSCCRNYPQENAEKMKQAEQFLKEGE